MSYLTTNFNLSSACQPRSLFMRPESAVPPASIAAAPPPAGELKVTRKDETVSHVMFFDKLAPIFPDVHHEEKVSTLNWNNQVLLSISDPQSSNAWARRLIYKDAAGEPLFTHIQENSHLDIDDQYKRNQHAVNHLDTNATQAKVVTKFRSDWNGEFHGLFLDQATQVQIHVETNARNMNDPLSVNVYDPTHGVRLEMSDEGKVAAWKDCEPVAMPKPDTKLLIEQR